ncbi:hypothetical protein BCR33DRAFT_583324 [Rhizoclosmatium globosum]|uniref:Xylanolytic transcriptional activator regulatory domain-containing protein n=1 Tax=Rhizoclosmatium globosum TaxID=329046 RepID=A0A1Y2CSX3_9FUNG|nr:hypothetical protein BCR33DRAFT_583324 [Rhizoclosmatium globosum]|eukprot:ORY49465.1 hypothetical protein BCR33DRAFT_583324 [Rhizoclosmatium globosum]
MNADIQTNSNLLHPFHLATSRAITRYPQLYPRLLCDSIGCLSRRAVSTGIAESPYTQAISITTPLELISNVSKHRLRTWSRRLDVGGSGSPLHYAGLLPRMEFMTADLRATVLNLCDGQQILSCFFQQPAPIRLILCAIAANYSYPPLPQHIILSYYQRARKAVLRYGHKASVRNIQAHLYIFYFTMWKGQPIIGLPFLQYAFSLSVQLNLHIDPDHIPSLYNLSVVEKEERRRLFWQILHTTRWVQSLTPHFHHQILEPSTHQLKYTNAVPGHFIEFGFAPYSLSLTTSLYP